MFSTAVILTSSLLGLTPLAHAIAPKSFLTPNNHVLRRQCNGTLCGWAEQLCCTVDEVCSTDANLQERCVPRASVGAGSSTASVTSIAISTRSPTATTSSVTSSKAEVFTRSEGIFMTESVGTSSVDLEPSGARMSGENSTTSLNTTTRPTSLVATGGASGMEVSVGGVVVGLLGFLGLGTYGEMLTKSPRYPSITNIHCKLIIIIICVVTCYCQYSVLIGYLLTCCATP